MVQQNTYDFLIVGSGFAGSITAMALANSGFRICLIERAEHPRFAVGESSTPIADMILRDLADNYDLPFLKKLSRYGEWQKNYPEIICGLKRGFSYYHHQKGKQFESDESHSKELLVAASENDQNSDTNWLRSDVDHFLINKVKESEVSYLDRCEIKSVVRSRKDEIWDVEVLMGEKFSFIKTSWIIDASGSAAFSETCFGTLSSSEGFETNSKAIYTHFDHVNTWNWYLNDRRFKTDDYPYNPDHSALHHIIDEGWIWMLRFNNGLLSSGLVMDGSESEFETELSKERWKQIVESYPSLKRLFNHAQIAEKPGRYFRTERLQRRLDKTHGDGWVVLNHTAGFVDPLHSTGIAHTLTGVEKILNVFAQKRERKKINFDLNKLEDNIFKELTFIDLLVSSSYRSRSHAGLFNASVMLYFIASIQYEQSRLAGKIPDTFLCAGNTDLRKMVKQTHDDIKRLTKSDYSESDAQELIRNIKSRIEPYNSAGLMNPLNKNMYSHTAVTL